MVEPLPRLKALPLPQPQAFFVVYDGAIYLHQGATYMCTRLDLGARVAEVRPTRAKYYTSVGVGGRGKVLGTHFKTHCLSGQIVVKGKVFSDHPRHCRL